MVERVGDEAAGAGAAAGADRDRALLGPLDEVGDDQEVAGEAHVLDDAELEVEPLAVGLGGRGVRDRREAGVEAGAGLAAQLLDLVVGEARQDRLALLRAEGAAAGDLDGARHRLGQVGEERDHLVLGLEAVLGGQPAARLLLVDVGAVGDAEQRVVGGVQRRGWGSARRWWRPAAGRGRRRGRRGRARSPPRRACARRRRPGGAGPRRRGGRGRSRRGARPAPGRGGRGRRRSEPRAGRRRRRSGRSGRSAWASRAARVTCGSAAPQAR